MTLQNAKSSCGTDRETKKCGKYQRMDDIHSPVWVDTVGWDDAECEDEDNFKEVLRFIAKNDITRVQAIVWNVIPNVRRDALLSKQASLIDMFKPKEIWNNVVIVLKQSMNPENDGKGALRAALEYDPHSKLQIVGYRFLEDQTITDEQRENLQDANTRKIFNVKTNEEIRELLGEKVNEIGKPIKVIFQNKKCIDCDQVGDERLMSSYCHMEAHQVHLGTIERHHPLGTEYYHPSENHIAEHDGFLQKPWYSVLCLFKTKRYSCCNKLSGRPGCTYKWACCRSLVNTPSSGRRGKKPTGCKSRFICCKTDCESDTTGCEPRYGCCGIKVNNGNSNDGCKKVCKKCNKNWGSNAGECFKKSHNIRDINYTEHHPATRQESIQVADQIDSVSDHEVQIKLNGQNYSPPVIFYHVF